MLINRYCRQTVLPQVGILGQEKLRRAKVLCIGAGGLGSPVLSYLAAAGVGRIGIVDPDRVEISNLQRQVLFQETDTGKFKVEVARQRLLALNSEVSIEIYAKALNKKNALDIMGSYDLVIDGTDNFKTKFLINDAAFKLGLPLVYASVSGFEAQLATFSGLAGPCYRCLYPKPLLSVVPNCAEAGVLGALVGVIGSLQALEVIHCILNNFQVQESRLKVFDGLGLQMSNYRISKRSDCVTCSHPREELAWCEEDETEVICYITDQDLSLTTLWLDVRSEEEWQEGHIANALHWPLPRLQQGWLPDLPLGTDITLYCAAGTRSQAAIQILIQRGFSKVRHLAAGLASWKEPLVRN